jgi:hypothetical protein
VKLKAAKATLEEKLNLEQQKRVSAVENLKIVLTEKLGKWKRKYTETIMQIEDFRSMAAKRTE